MGIQNNKISYYDLLKKKMKKSYDLIQTSEYNVEFSFKVNRFVATKKKRILDLFKGEIYDWKFYLLNKLNMSIGNIGNWEGALHDFIEDTFQTKKCFEKYFLDNEMFLNQFSLRNCPQEALKDSENKHEPLLFTLYDTEEIDSYFEKMQKSRNKKEKNKTNINRNQTESSLEIELFDVHITQLKEESEIMDIINTNENYIVKGRSKGLTIGKLNESESKFLNKDISEEINKNKYYSYQIRKHINLIRRQLEKQKHPINIIIKRFAEIYSTYINDCYPYINQEKNEKEKKLEDIKKEIIKDIQNFIDIIAIALKLFYMKSINYDYFDYEKDEFINLICFFLFNEKNFEKSLFDFFELSNQKEQEKLNIKKKQFGIITPKDTGISIKFRLNEDTENFKKNKTSDEDKLETGIVKYFKALDVEIDDQHKNSFYVEINRMETISSFCSSRKMSYFEPDKSTDKNTSLITNKNDNIVYKLKKNVKDKKKKGKEWIEAETIKNYKEFGEKFIQINDHLREKYKEDINDNLSESEIKTEKTKYDPKDPYRKAINFIETIKEYKTPLNKLTIIALVSAIIIDCVNECWKDEINIDNNYLRIDSDELLSIYLYILCNMDTKSIYTQLDYINYFTGIITKQSMVGYYYTTVEGCLKYFMDVKNKEELAKNPTKKENKDNLD